MAALQNCPSIHRRLLPSTFSQQAGLQKQGTVPSSCRRGSPFAVRAEQFVTSDSASAPIHPPSPGQCKRRPLLLGIGAIASSLLPAASVLAEEIPPNYQSFVDLVDGYSYYYPSDWREFEFRGHDSAFKDRYLQLQNVRVRFIPTDMKDIHDMGPMEEVVTNLVNNVYAAPNQMATILGMQEKTINGKNYYTFEYGLKSPNFTSTSFATVAVANGRYYTLTVAANERRWRRVRNKLKVVADSFQVLDI
ncbi:photosynthetic NDH subunit of lumenal location 1, chloroplastic [Punica granatum]|uniref:Photosynthetic NDH subunit of lumenal location 1, chloroplastic n=2 Tax=Punica granatum TaxID=22663 RepID=A0A6P8CH64_PUNGR|nr:photosynthetic NDH subunit of lumenal location 1, chloroplastic [Punica granatum]PKI35223.1 hypothetical protein CRG98_044389 [Punica granatum]